MRFARYGKMDFPISYAFGIHLRASIRKSGRTSGLVRLGLQFHRNSSHLPNERRKLAGTILWHFPNRFLQLVIFYRYRLPE